MNRRTLRGFGRTLSLLLAAALLIGMTVTVSASDNRGLRLYHGAFSYDGTSDFFYYGDSYFSAPFEQENEHLRTMSAALAFSAASEPITAAAELMTDLGMDQQSIAVTESAPDQVGTVIAHKTIGDKALVALAIGGDTTDPAGSAAVISGRVQAYCQDHAVSSALFWLCGYDDAGEVAALLGDMMNESPALYHAEKDYIYVYGFAAESADEHDMRHIFARLKDQDGFYTAGVRITPGDVVIGQTRYTFDENGWPLEDLALAAGFSEDDLAKWRDGYELRLNNVVTDLDDPEAELYYKAYAVLDKSMSIYRYDEVKMTKTVAFRTYPVDLPVKLKQNPICLTVPQNIANVCVRYAVVRIDDDGVEKLDPDVVFSDSGDARLWVNAAHPAVYITAIDDRRWSTHADVDRDKEITVMDATHIQRYLASMEDFDEYQRLVSDIDGDGYTTSIDAAWIIRYLVRINVPDEIRWRLESSEN